VTSPLFNAGQYPTSAELEQLSNRLAGMTQATVATSQTTTSTSFTDLATVGPTVTVTVGDSGIVEVVLSTQISNVGGNHAYASFTTSGANVSAAADTRAIYIASTNVTRFSGSFPLTGLAPGITTFTMKYRVSASTGTFADRTLHIKTF